MDPRAWWLGNCGQQGFATHEWAGWPSFPTAWAPPAGWPSWPLWHGPHVGTVPREQQEEPLLASVKELRQHCPGSPCPLGQWVVPGGGAVPSRPGGRPGLEGPLVRPAFRIYCKIKA